MENTARVKAQLMSSTTKGSTVLQFELDSDCKTDGSLAKILTMVRHAVTLEITDEQMVLDINEETPGQMEAFADDEQENVIVLELPESYVEEADDEE